MHSWNIPNPVWIPPEQKFQFGWALGQKLIPPESVEDSKDLHFFVLFHLSILYISVFANYGCTWWGKQHKLWFWFSQSTHIRITKPAICARFACFFVSKSSIFQHLQTMVLILSINEHQNHPKLPSVPYFCVFLFKILDISILANYGSSSWINSANYGSDSLNQSIWESPKLTFMPCFWVFFSFKIVCI